MHISRSSKHSGDGKTKLQTSVIEVGSVDGSLTVNEEGEEVSELVDLENDVVEPVVASLARANTFHEHVINVIYELLSGTIRLCLLVSVG